MGQNNISDDDFITSYEKRHEQEFRSDRYVKGKTGGKSIKTGFWIFLAVVFLLVYYLFSEFWFIPQ